MPVEASQHRNVSRYFEWLDKKEICYVRYQNNLTAHSSLRTLAILVNRLGNGWIYIPVLALLLLKGARGLFPFVAGAVAVLVTHAVYPVIKGTTARLRPFEIDPTLQVRTRALDRYSFPSGHCMTATAVFIPIAIAFPQCVPALVAFFLILAWAQIACALHYPTDLFCGTIMGAGISGTICEFILQLI